MRDTASLPSCASTALATKTVPLRRGAAGEPLPIRVLHQVLQPPVQGEPLRQSRHNTYNTEVMKEWCWAPPQAFQHKPVGRYGRGHGGTGQEQQGTATGVVVGTPAVDDPPVRRRLCRLLPLPLRLQSR